ncbi:protein TIFY 5 [Oryza glaberrima]|uniref:Protein TIFY n=3 Tax=Oryza TaxID=4527 RepID=A0A0D3GMD7_9ORYZ|nr:protein TIFY 5 [Oryza glaberrima]
MAEERRRDDGGDVEVELSLRLRTGDDSTSADPAPATAAAEARRNLTIFYNGRMCAVNVTELQARTIISMASQGNFGKQQQQQIQGRDDHHYHQGESSSGGGVSTAAARHCDVAGSSSSHSGSGSGSATPPRPALVSPRAGLQAAAAAAPTMNQPPAASGLSMKRSLQRFLEKRKTRAAAPLYARR